MAYFETVLASNDAYIIREHKPAEPYVGETHYTIEIRHGSNRHSLDNLRSLRAALNEALAHALPYDVRVEGR